MSRFLRVGLLLVPTFVGVPAAAQTDPASQPSQSPAPAHIAVVDGDAWLDRQDRSERAPTNMPLITGDRLRTENGRAEVIFGDGSVLDLDHFTTVDFQSPSLMRLLAGRVRLVIAGLDPDDPSERVDYRVDAPSGYARLLSVGDYGLALVGAPAATDLEVAVLRGSAEVATDLGSVMVSPGERSYARLGSPPSYPTAFNSARWDAFDRWSEAQRDARLGVSSASYSYLPTPVRSYAATFDHHGYWQHHPSYGYVWYPSVSVGWRPYSYGHWNFVGSFGWTWIGYDRWAWPTHHYGRWGFSAGAWFWIPGFTWAPAWVSWAWSPGYVGWCPLGYNGWPVVGFSAFATNGYARGPHHPWHGWTVARADAFAGGHVAVPRHEVPVENLDASTRAAFTGRSDAPAPRGLATSRAAQPIRAVGGRAGFAVPRSPTSSQIISPSAPRPGSGAAPGSPSPMAAAADRRAVTRAPAGGGLGAPPRIGPTAGSPGLGALARRPSAGAGGTPQPPTQTFSRPRREPVPPSAPAVPADRSDRWGTRMYGPVYGTSGEPRSSPRSPETASVPEHGSRPDASRRSSPQPGAPPRAYTPPDGFRSVPARPRDDGSVTTPRGPAPGALSPPAGGRGPAPREYPSAPRGGGVERGAPPPRAPSGAQPGSRGLPAGSPPGAPRGGPGGAAVRRAPG